MSIRQITPADTFHNRGAANSGAYERYLRPLKRGIWVYFWLLLFEGALRKWILPGLATPLLLIRDPVAVWLLITAYNKRFATSSYAIILWIIGVVAVLLALGLGHGNLGIALYGARILMIHFPLMFVIGQIFTKQDVIKMGVALLWVTLPMTVLMAMQFYSPQSALVNRGIGGDISGGGFSGAMGYFRPPGTFSFINGLVSFYGLVAGYVFYFWLDDSNLVKRWLLIAATSCLLLAVPLSISRSLIFEVALSAIFTTAMAFRKPKLMGRILGAFLGLTVLLIILSNIELFSTGVNAISSRFDTASQTEGGLENTIVDRFLGGLVTAITDTEQFPFWGLGIGMGTNAGAKLLTGKLMFLFAEGEWGRLIGEMGIILGFAAVFLRIELALSLGIKAFKAIGSGNYLPWMLLSFAFMNLLQVSLAQPTSLGFTVLAGGVVMGAFRER